MIVYELERFKFEVGVQYVLFEFRVDGELFDEEETLVFGVDLETLQRQTGVQAGQLILLAQCFGGEFAVDLNKGE